jgi:hypothetical protein
MGKETNLARWVVSDDAGMWMPALRKGSKEGMGSTELVSREGGDEQL